MTTATQEAPKAKRLKFRLMKGKHVDWEPEDLHLPGGQRRQREFLPGDIVETETDLSKTIDKHAKEGHRKFERVYEDTPGTPANAHAPVEPPKPAKPKGPPVTYEEMMKKSLKELQDIVAEEEIDPRGAKNKEELAKLIVAEFGK